MRYSESTMLYNEIRMPSSESIQDVYLIFGGGGGELPSIRRGWRRGGVAAQREGCQVRDPYKMFP